MSSEAGERGRGQHLEGLACHALMMQNHRKVLDKGAVRSDLNFMKIILARKGETEVRNTSKKAAMEI